MYALTLKQNVCNGVYGEAERKEPESKKAHIEKNRKLFMYKSKRIR